MFQKLVDKLNALRPKQVLMLAIVAAGLMFLTIFIGVRSLMNEEVVVTPQPQAEKTVSVVVAKTNIQPRTIIQENMLQMKDIPEKMVPEGAIKSFADVLGVQVKVSIFAGDVLTIQKVFSDKEEGFAASIPANCRAVSISVNDLTGVAGFAKPGDHVDLLLVEHSAYSATTTVLLQNVPLMSVNQDATGAAPVGENGVPKNTVTNPSIATFALPPEDVLKLISATRLGEIYMMLRPTNPQAAYVGEMEYTIESVNKPEPPKEQPVEPPPVIPSNPLPELPSIPVTPQIEIIQGDQVVTQAAPQPTVTHGATQSVLPAIPSGATPVFTPPPAPPASPAESDH